MKDWFRIRRYDSGSVEFIGWGIIILVAAFLINVVFLVMFAISELTK